VTILPVVTIKYVNLILNYLEIVGKMYSKEMCRYYCIKNFEALFALEEMR
jgi:hypothetical protein